MQIEKVFKKKRVLRVFKASYNTRKETKSESIYLDGFLKIIYPFIFFIFKPSLCPQKSCQD